MRASPPGRSSVTLGDTEERRRYLNARSTIAKLLELKCVPVINENDTVATSEIRYGDNDRLAARVAGMASADLLVLLSDIDGLYTAPPNDDPDAELIPVVPRITAEIEAMAGSAGSELSRGGMKTKIEAGKIATTAGAHMLIASGKVKNPLRAVETGARCTWFLAPANPVASRKRWIAGALEPRGTLHLDAGAVAALRRGTSLLPAGVTRVEGTFQRGDAVVLRGPDGAEIGRGLVAYDADYAERIKGRSSDEIATITGFEGRAAMVHRDDLVVGGASTDRAKAAYGRRQGAAEAAVSAFTRSGWHLGRPPPPAHNPLNLPARPLRRELDRPLSDPIVTISGLEKTYASACRR